MKLTIGMMAEYLRRFGIISKISREKVWSGSCYFETDCIKLSKGNKSICIKPWEILGNETIIYDEEKKEHRLADLNLEVKTLKIGTCITNEKGVWPPYDSHSCFSNNYEEIFKKYIIDFLGLIQVSDAGELSEQQVLF